MKRVRFSSAAFRDLAEAKAWYAEQSPHLDSAFGEELDGALERMRAYPASFPIVERTIRRANLRRFPYGVFYIERREHLLVIAVVHHARSPQHWRRRG